LIAYSTVAQIGYLFLLFPLYCGGMSSALWGGMFQAISHAFAKASMFMAAGLFAEVLGHDRLAGLRGVGRILPLSAFGFGLAALSLVGVPPTGGFYAKWLLLTSAFRTTQWAWVIVIGLGGLLAGAYMYRALSPVWREPDQALPQGVPVSRLREGVVVALALCALLTGLFPQPITTLLRIGHVSVTQHTLQP